MSTIKFHHYSDHISNLKHMAGLFRILYSLPDNSEFEVASTGFVTPFQVIPFACIIRNKGLKPVLSNPESNITSYLNTVHFPIGLNAKDAEAGKSGNYIPIVSLIDIKTRDESLENDFSLLELKYGNLIMNCYPSVEEKLKNAVSFFLAELIENAKDHADADNFYIFAQYWPKINEFELCMMDDGIGLYGSISKRHTHIKNDESALREVVQRKLSTRIGEVEALPGTGIANTIKIIGSKKIQSNFTLISGNSGYYMVNGISNWVSFGTLRFPGTLINIRIKDPRNRLNIFDYIS